MNKVDRELCFVDMQTNVYHFWFHRFLFPLETMHFFILSVFLWVPEVVRKPEKLALSLPIVAFWHLKYLCILVIPNFRGGLLGGTALAFWKMSLTFFG